MNSCAARILMFPWLGYGHITPYLQLAKKLSSKGFYIYLCSTPATLTFIDKKISQNIELVPLLLESSPDLPANLHTTNGLPLHLMPKLKQAFDNSVENFSAIIDNLRPHLLIFDFLQPWASSVAEAHKIPSVLFITSSSIMTSFMFHYLKTPNTAFPFKNIAFRDYETRFMEKLLATSRDAKEREFSCAGVERSCKIVLIKGFREIEGKYIDYVSELAGKKFVPVGPLCQDPIFSDNEDAGSQGIFSWLDKKETKSTVFVSFGSEYYLSEADLAAIAHGLLLSNVNFIWVVRFEAGCKKFPEGFLEGVGDRGKILEGWCPQTKILSHENVGGFVSHCGWNSVLESMKIGVPIIAVPMHLDQPINARLIEEVGVGKEVLRDRAGRLCGEQVAEVISYVMVEEEGEPVRRKVAEIKAKIEAKGDEEIDQVAQQLHSILCLHNQEFNQVIMNSSCSS